MAVGHQFHLNTQQIYFKKRKTHKTLVLDLNH